MVFRLCGFEFFQGFFVLGAADEFRAGGFSRHSPVAYALYGNAQVRAQPLDEIFRLKVGESNA